MCNETLSILGIGFLGLLIACLIIGLVKFLLNINHLFNEVEKLNKNDEDNVMHVHGTTIEIVNNRINSIENRLVFIDSYLNNLKPKRKKE